MLAKLEARISELMAELEKSAAHHNGLVGMLMEAKNIYETAKKDAAIVKPAVDAVASVIPAIEPAAGIVDELAAA